jgi:hypothetical protein
MKRNVSILYISIYPKIGILSIFEFYSYRVRVPTGQMCARGCVGNFNSPLKTNKSNVKQRATFHLEHEMFLL